MEDIIVLLSDEVGLKAKSINGYNELFLIENLLILIKKQEGISSDCYLYYLENAVLMIYNRIKNNPKYHSQVNQIKEILEIVPITEEVIDRVKNLFEKIYNECTLYYNPNIIVKNLI